MRAAKIDAACGLVAIVVVVGVAMILVISKGATNASAGDGQLDADASARVVQAEVARVDLTGRLEVALGDAFGGVWFNTPGNELHVGVTSPASRAAVAAIAERAGLAAHVVETTVDSTWADLSASQDRWDRRLTDLLRRYEATTWLAPVRNSVMVQLGSAVPVAEREALERKAAGEGVSISISSRPKFLIELQVSRCNKWASGSAACNPTIVAGQTLARAGSECTAGPTVLFSDAAKNTTETFLLSSGHCLDTGGGLNSPWEAIDKNGKEPEVGKVVELKVPGTDKVDAGLIKIETKGGWATPQSLTPVVATVAPWNVTPDPEPFAVTGAGKPVLDAMTCLSASSTGWHCGKILKTSLSSGTLKEIVEVEDTSAKKGDSGGPWVSESSTGTVTGIHIGNNLGTGKALFQSVTYVLTELTTGVQLLTAANQTRPACPMKEKKCWFEAESYPVTYQGTNELGKEKITTEAGAIECTGSFHGKSTTGLLHPTYTSCKAFGLGSATVKTEGCDYQLEVEEELTEDEFSALTEIVCGAGAAIKVSAGNCELEIGSQSGLGSVKLKNDTAASPKKDITISPEISGLDYTVTKDGFGCPFGGTGEKTTGTYTTSNPLTVSGQDPEAAETKIGITAVEGE